jgi:TatD DNase family protein
MIDTHTHLDFKEFDKDRKEVIERAFLSGVKKIINVGCDLETSKNSVELSNCYENIFAATGIHPGEINEQKTEINEQINELRKLAENKKVIAIGEIGLDCKESKKLNSPASVTTSKILAEALRAGNLQKEILKAQIELAQELNLPIIFHCRMAHNDLLKILKKFPACHRAVIHCFTGNYQQAKKYLEMGFYLGFGGIIFKMNLDEIIKKIPLDRILIETDCPFLIPPQKNESRNEPAFVKYTAQKIAEIKKMSFQEIEKITTQNAEKLFRI